MVPGFRGVRDHNNHPQVASTGRTRVSPERTTSPAVANISPSEGHHGVDRTAILPTCCICGVASMNLAEAHPCKCRFCDDCLMANLLRGGILSNSLLVDGYPQWPVIYRSAQCGNIIDYVIRQEDDTVYHPMDLTRISREMERLPSDLRQEIKDFGYAMTDVGDQLAPLDPGVNLDLERTAVSQARKSYNRLLRDGHLHFVRKIVQSRMLGPMIPPRQHIWDDIWDEPRTGPVAPFRTSMRSDSTLSET